MDGSTPPRFDLASEIDRALAQDPGAIYARDLYEPLLEAYVDGSEAWGRSVPILRRAGVYGDLVARLRRDAKPLRRPQQERRTDDRPRIVVGPDEMRVADEALAALAARGGVYQRGGALVDIIHDDDHGAPVIHRLTRATLRERLSDAATYTVDDDKTVAPPDPSTAALLDRGEWLGIPVLAGVASYPIVAPSGEIVTERGYHAGTRMWVEPSVQPVMPSSLPDAVACLRDPLVDFPFSGPGSEAAVIAAICTVLARPAIEGPTPIFVFGSNTPGTGKGFLAAIVGIIATGHAPAPGPQTADEEFRKRVLGVLESGAPIAQLDDCKHTLGGGTIDRLATAWPYYEDRRLRGHEIVRVPARTVWLATGVHVEIGDHTARRVILCELESPLEKPEERDDFRHRDILAHVHGRRAHLLGAALYLLQAHAQAGRPQHDLRAMGSYTSWSRVVRSALVHAGLADPLSSIQTVAPSQDRLAYRTLLGDAGLPQMIRVAGVDLDGGERGITAATIEKHLEGHPVVAEAIGQMARRPDARAIGYALRKHRRRPVAGRMLDSVPGPGGVAAWVVREATAQHDRGPLSSCDATPEPKREPGDDDPDATGYGAGGGRLAD